MFRGRGFEPCRPDSLRLQHKLKTTAQATDQVLSPEPFASVRMPGATSASTPVDVRSHQRYHNQPRLAQCHADHPSIFLSSSR